MSRGSVIVVLRMGSEGEKEYLTPWGAWSVSVSQAQRFHADDTIRDPRHPDYGRRVADAEARRRGATTAVLIADEPLPGGPVTVVPS